MRIPKVNKKYLLLFILGILLAFVILELILRITEKKHYDYTDCTSLDKNFHHVMIANKTCRYKTDEWDVLYKINSWGLRDSEFSLKKKDDEFRILLLGDSFTQGLGVDIDKSYAAILEKNLNAANLQKKVKVINSGVFAYSPLVEYLYLKEKGLSFEPDMIVLTFNLTDFWDDRTRFNELKSVYNRLSDDQLKDKIVQGNVEFNFEAINTTASVQKNQKFDRSVFLYKTKLWLRKNVRIYKELSGFVKKRKQTGADNQKVSIGDPDNDFVAVLRGQSISDETWDALWNLPVYNIRLASDLAKNNNIPFVVVVIPDATQISKEGWQTRSMLDLSDDYTDPRGPYEDELKKRLEPLSIPVIDLLSTFKKSGELLYFKYDNHWNEKGHKLAGEEIFNQFKPLVVSVMEMKK